MSLQSPNLPTRLTAADHSGRRLSLSRWIGLCAAAESIGMAAAATGAKLSQAIVGEPTTAGTRTVALSLVVVGGLIEGAALGELQAAGLRRLLPRLNRRRWLLVTVAVAGVGWAGASVPAVLSANADASSPPLLLVTCEAAGLGVAMGALLGATQARQLRGLVRHPGRWIAANAAGWAPAMAITFLGATTPRSEWRFPAVMALGAATGLVAGGVLGLVTGWFLPTLNGPPAHNRVVSATLQSPAHHLLDRSLLVLRVRGAMTGRIFELPVQYARDNDHLAVVPGHPQTKLWWRDLLVRSAVDVLLSGEWLRGTGVMLRPGDHGYDAAPRPTDTDGRKHICHQVVP